MADELILTGAKDNDVFAAGIDCDQKGLPNNFERGMIRAGFRLSLSEAGVLNENYIGEAFTRDFGDRVHL
jgi:hypothetical protein